VCLPAEQLDGRKAELAYDHYQILVNYLAGNRPGLRWS